MRGKRNWYVSARFFCGFPWLRLASDGRICVAFAGLACGVALSLGGCAQTPPQHLASAHSKEYFPSSIYGPASPRVVADGEPVPRGGGMYMVGKPYSIAGRTYYPSERHYAAIGLASWYGDAFHGRRTANGEVYDRDSISAAHPTMPLPCYARVTNLRNNYSMIVRVNDRGPFAADRIMDVSRKAAEALGFRQIGTTPVKVEYVGAASLAGSDDQKLLATLRSDRPASVAAVEDHGPSLLAEGVPMPIAVADTQPFPPAADDALNGPSSTPAGHASGSNVPLPPVRPLNLGRAPGTAGPIALR
ncbi:MAG TPA: septal ring lytic transglycosylase RlpA family protein [Methylocella sp.]|nr:septal ring lytic transglycosylase RlpA family protein [Methylocella sp.]